MKTADCRRCGKSFPLPATRGRPPVFCSDACRDGKTPRITRVTTVTTISTILDFHDPVAIVDHLEMSLKARGTHISQNRGQYE